MKINLLKSKLIGVGVMFSQVVDVENCVGCGADFILFIYLGEHVGQNMARVSAWSAIIECFRSFLAGWKAKCLSFGGHLTLIKFI